MLFRSPTQRDDKNPIVDALCAEIRTANDRLAAAVGVSSRSSIDRQRYALNIGCADGGGRRVEAAIGKPVMTLVHELVELGAISCNAEALQEFLELALLVFEPTQRLSA